MKNSTFRSASEPGWRKLGELELPIGTSANTSLQLWLLDILDPISLATDFLNRVLASIQEAVARALRSENEMKSGHLHISIYVPYDSVSKGKTWGFFHTEKIGGHTDDIPNFGHSMDFYLYVEG